jgi:hypothetical protein
MSTFVVAKHALKRLRSVRGTLTTTTSVAASSFIVTRLYYRQPSAQQQCRRLSSRHFSSSSSPVEQLPEEESEPVVRGIVSKEDEHKEETKRKRLSEVRRLLRAGFIFDIVSIAWNHAHTVSFFSDFSLAMLSLMCVLVILGSYFRSTQSQAFVSMG